LKAEINVTSAGSEAAIDLMTRKRNWTEGYTPPHPQSPNLPFLAPASPTGASFFESCGGSWSLKQKA
jgi:hypothetical protein